MSNHDVADVSYDQDGNIEQFLLFIDGEPDTRRGTTKNILLFDPEDELPFDGGLHSFLNGENALKIGENPETIVAQSGDEYSYIISIDGDVIETVPKHAERFLKALRAALTENDTSKIIDLYQDIISDQVRRQIVNSIKHTFNESKRINVTANGWLIDEFYLVDWNAKMYTANNDPDEDDFVRDGDSVKKDKSYEFVRLRKSFGEVEEQNVVIDGSQYTLTEREILFLSKVTWLLDREHYHPDDPFWTFSDRWATMPSDEPDLDSFSL